MVTIFQLFLQLNLQLSAWPCSSRVPPFTLKHPLVFGGFSLIVLVWYWFFFFRRLERAPWSSPRLCSDPQIWHNPLTNFFGSVMAEVASASNQCSHGSSDTWSAGPGPNNGDMQVTSPPKPRVTLFLLLTALSMTPSLSLLGLLPHLKNSSHLCST